MCDVDMEIDSKALNELGALLQRISAATPEALRSETRHAAILLCKSLRSRTRVAPKQTRRKEYEAHPVEYAPKYVHSNSAHHKLLHGWTLIRKVGTPDAYDNRHFVYTKAHRDKSTGKMVGKDLSAERKELLEQHGGISRPGLAKLSWGWIMKQIYAAAAVGEPLAYKPRKHEKRDPREAVKGLFRAVKTGAFAEINNALDYIGAALRPGALNKSVEAATKNLYHQVEAKLLEAETGRGTSAAPASNVKWWSGPSKYEIAHGRASPIKRAGSYYGGTGI